MDKEIVLSDYPTSLEWIKKTKKSIPYSGSYSKNRMFTAGGLRYRIWSDTNAETEKKEIHACCWLENPGISAEREKISYTEGVYEFSAEGLLAFKTVILDLIAANSTFFE